MLWMVNIRIIYSMTCHYQPLTGSLTSAFHRRVDPACWWLGLAFQYSASYAVTLGCCKKGWRDLAVTSSWKGKKKLCYKIRSFDPGLETVVKLLRFKVCFRSGGNEIKQLTTMAHSDNPLYTYLLNFKCFDILISYNLTLRLFEITELVMM